MTLVASILMLLKVFGSLAVFLMFMTIYGYDMPPGNNGYEESEKVHLFLMAVVVLAIWL